MSVESFRVRGAPTLEVAQISSGSKMVLWFQLRKQMKQRMPKRSRHRRGAQQSRHSLPLLLLHQKESEDLRGSVPASLWHMLFVDHSW
jgi:hypothetical protein